MFEGWRLRGQGQRLQNVSLRTSPRPRMSSRTSPLFTSDGRQDEELDTQTGKGSAVMRALHYSVVMKQEMLKKAKLSIFKIVFVPFSPMVMNLG